MNSFINGVVDSFADIDDLEDLKKNPTQEKMLEKDIIKKIAEDSNFQSRRISDKKQKTYNKTFSLFQEDCNIINKVIRSYFNKFEDDLSRPSGSDVIRAALHIFSEKNIDEQLSIIRKYRGRGRK